MITPLDNYLHNYYIARMKKLVYAIAVRGEYYDDMKGVTSKDEIFVKDNGGTKSNTCVTTSLAVAF